MYNIINDVNNRVDTIQSFGGNSNVKTSSICDMLGAEMNDLNRIITELNIKQADTVPVSYTSYNAPKFMG